MAKGEREQAGGRQGRKAAPVNNKPRGAVAGEAQFRDKPKTDAGTKNRSKAGVKAGARPGTKRSSGAKPSGTNVSKGGGSAAKRSRGSR